MNPKDAGDLNSLLLTAAEVGRRLGLSRQRIHQLVREGHIHPAVERRGPFRAFVMLFTTEEADRIAELRSRHPTLKGPLRWGPQPDRENPTKT